MSERMLDWYVLALNHYSLAKERGDEEMIKKWMDYMEIIELYFNVAGLTLQKDYATHKVNVVPL